MMSHGGIGSRRSEHSEQTETNAGREKRKTLESLSVERHASADGRKIAAGNISGAVTKAAAEYDGKKGTDEKKVDVRITSSSECSASVWKAVMALAAVRQAPVGLFLLF